MKKLLMFCFVLFFINSCGNNKTETNIKNNINTISEKKISIKNSGELLKKEEKNIEKETIKMLKYQLSLEDDILLKNLEENIKKIETKRTETKKIETKISNKILEKNKNSKIEKHKKSIENKISVSNLDKVYIDYFSKKDYDGDSSIFKYIDNKVHYNNLPYSPKNLVKLEGKFIIDAKYNSKVRKITLINLNKLSEKFFKEFGIKLKIVSAYRSYNYQKGIKDRGCPDLFCAKAGYSEHQSGLAIDFWAATELKNYKNNKNLKKYFKWMKINGPKYGFTNSYQNGLEIDGYAVEPWHWRFVGKNLASYLSKKNITLAEFYYKNIKK